MFDTGHMEAFSIKKLPAWAVSKFFRFAFYTGTRPVEFAPCIFDLRRWRKAAKPSMPSPASIIATVEFSGTAATLMLPPKLPPLVPVTLPIADRVYSPEVRLEACKVHVCKPVLEVRCPVAVTPFPLRVKLLMLSPDMESSAIEITADETLKTVPCAKVKFSVKVLPLVPSPYEAPIDELGPLKVIVEVLLMSVDAWTAALDSIKEADRNTPEMTFFIE